MRSEFWEELNQEDSSIKIWCSSDNWANKNGGGLEDLLNTSFKLEFKLFFNKDGEVIDLSGNCGGVAIRQCSIPRGYEKKIKQFGFTQIETLEQYRNIGVCTVLLCRLIGAILRLCPNVNCTFWLANTTRVVQDKKKIYSSILDNYQNDNIQYKEFMIENREEDLAKLKKLCENKEEKIREYFNAY